MVDRLHENSVLANRLPGTVILLRGDGKHYFVKIGNRESMYAAVAVR
jgi:acid stress-induced BolA-like protein IbaG/YrbA